MEERRKYNKSLDEVVVLLENHEKEEAITKESVARLTRVIFGDEIVGEIGMKEKVDEIHSLLVQAKNVGGFFGGVKSLAGWMLVMGAVIALLKGWAYQLFVYILRP